MLDLSETRGDRVQPQLDLDAYLRRIGYDGPRKASLEVLNALHALHPRAIPFENLDPLMGITPRLDLESLQTKLIAGQRGGCCFEQNGLFEAALEVIGFQVEGLMARAQWSVPPDRVNPRIHKFLKVSLPEGEFQVDVGFASMTQTGPLRLIPEIEQTVGGAVYRFMPFDAEELQLQTRLADSWSPMYRFPPQSFHPIDYELANWYVATHPHSMFVNNLMAAFVGADRRYALANQRLSIYHFDGRIERRALSGADIDTLLHETFGIARVGDPQARAALYAKFAAA